MRPIKTSITVPYPPEPVYDFLDVMANHEPFTDHMLTDWKLSGPERGVGARAEMTATIGGRSEPVEIEVVAAERPRMIAERNIGAGGRRVGTGTYTLAPVGDGGTEITFEYALQQAPLTERIAAPLVRAMLTSANRRALARLAEQLPVALEGPGTTVASSPER